MKEIRNSLYIILVAVCSIISCSSCSKEDEPTPSEYKPITAFGIEFRGRYVTPGPMIIGSQEQTLKFNMALGIIRNSATFMIDSYPSTEVLAPYPIYSNYKDEMEEPYNNAKFLGMWLENTNNPNERIRVKIKRISDDHWEGEGVIVNRVWHGEQYTLEITLPENTGDESRTFVMEWGDKISTIFYLIQGEADKFRAKYKEGVCI